MGSWTLSVLECFWQQHFCDPSPVLCTVALMFGFVCCLLLDHDSLVEMIVMEWFHLFTRELAPKVTVIFRHLVKGGHFPAC